MYVREKIACVREREIESGTETETERDRERERMYTIVYMHCLMKCRTIDFFLNLRM